MSMKHGFNGSEDEQRPGRCSIGKDDSATELAVTYRPR
jgi:hypothetical protein